jgi:hypothetical protein
MTHTRSERERRKRNDDASEVSSDSRTMDGMHESMTIYRNDGRRGANTYTRKSSAMTNYFPPTAQRLVHSPNNIVPTVMLFPF